MWLCGNERYRRDAINGVMKEMRPYCIIVGRTVTSLCTKDTGNNCDISKGTKIETISTNYTSILGTVMTTNFIMVSWSKQMWQGIVNRAVRLLASDPFESHFFSAVATVN
ncbi:hypothetical protein KIN20_025249 [Parelaphostrongylus tenuis]|uniref:Uncharacterized protein n=1 Tax=Parelaphostrongylus tenuis TaxID=148309 RepID=A0AAD5QUA5_PARTN|nr:hypothetical protein KIN20_025249 [Parelaphostrongylus tenuis]